VWTDFRVRVKNIVVVILLVYDKRKKAYDLKVTWHDVIGLEESRESLELGWHQGVWVPHGVYMVYVYMMEIKECDVRAYGHGIVALR